MPDGIAYQNKDIEFKLLGEAFRERSFEAYGLKLPRIKAVLPTNLPDVMADELRMDALFLLEDGTIAIVDYEARNRAADRVKYIDYIGRVMKRYLRDHHKIPNIRLIVIYTGDVLSAAPELKTECLTLCMEQVFVRHLPAKRIYRKAAYKLAHGQRLNERELMQLIILPLAEKGQAGKQERLRQVIGLAKQIRDDGEQKMVLSGLLVACDKFISRENAENIRREIRMTKVGKLLYEEGMEKGIEEGMERGMERGMRSGIKEGQRRTAEKLLRKRMDVQFILETTDLTEKEIREIQDGMAALH